MRLRLSIERHELPVVKILWHVKSAASTISKLLEQISDVVPLESDGWGLEDYAVHVHGYECLHYLETHKILNEDDEVSICALETPDIRVRTVSGRHQISAAGAHLIDGIPFGRNYLKRPARPPIHIPPRKRQRLVGDKYTRNNIGEHDNYEQPQLIDNNLENVVDDEDDEGAVLAIEDAAYFHADELPDSGMLRSGKRRKSVSFDEGSISSTGHPSGTSATDGVNQEGQDLNTIERKKSIQLGRQDSFSEKPPQYFRSANKISKHDTQVNVPVKGHLDKNSSRKSSQPQTSACSPPHQSFESSSSCNSSAEPPSSQSSFSNEDVPQHYNDDARSNSNSTSVDNSDENDENNTTSMSDSPSSDSISSSEVTSSDSGEDDSGCESDDSSILQHVDVNSKTLAQTPPPRRYQRSAPGKGKPCTRARNRRRARKKKLQKSREKELNALGTPSLTSASFNIPSNKSVKFEIKDNKAVFSPSNANESVAISQNLVLEAPQQSEMRRSETRTSSDTITTDQPIHQDAPPPAAILDTGNKPDVLITGLASALQQDPCIETPTLKTETQRATATKPARKGLLDFLNNSAGVEKGFSDVRVDTKRRFQEHHPSTTLDKESRLERQVLSTRIDHSEPEEEPVSKRQRSKLNLDGSRRLVFGALGVRNPKTKDDEGKVRLQLTTQAEKNLGNASKDISKKDAHKQPVKEGHPNNPSIDPEDWRIRIKLSAFECCDPDVQYSTPPFPFVQRWDPRQQFNTTSKKRKRKRLQQDYEEAEYNDNYSYPTLEYGELHPSTSFGVDIVNGTVGPTMQLLLDNEVRHSDNGTTNDNIDSTPNAFDNTGDLPGLPNDMNVLQDCTFCDAQPSMIIAFKQMECSEATLYRPSISAYRTAIIESVSKDDDQLILRLAKRDRTQPIEPRYDWEGNRILGRFEVVAEEDSGDEEFEDDGNLEVQFSELIDPKIVQYPFHRPQTVSEQVTKEEDSSGPQLSAVIVIEDDVCVKANAVFEDIAIEDEGEDVDDVQQDSMFTNENISATPEV